jgi:hypothetical protein
MYLSCSIRNPVFNIDKAVLEKLLKDKDEKIAFLRGLVGKE